MRHGLGMDSMCGCKNLEIWALHRSNAGEEVTRHWIQSYWPYRPVVHVHGNSLLQGASVWIKSEGLTECELEIDLS